MRVVNNLEWFKDMLFLEFVRNIGRHFSVSRMLAAECYKSRLETGLTFLEFSYMLMQSMTSSSFTAATTAACRSGAMTSGPTSWAAMNWYAGRRMRPSMQ